MKFFREVWRIYNHHLNRNPLRTKAAMCLFLSGSADISAQTINHYTGTCRSIGGNVIDNGKFLSNNSGSERENGSTLSGLPGWYGLPDIDWRRQASIWCYSLLYQFPFGHFWYNFIDRQTSHLPKHLVVPVKVLMDQTVDATAATLLYMSFVPWAEGRADLEWIIHKLRLDFVPTYIVDLSFWPIIMTLNFKFVPVKHQYLFANLAVFGWSTFLSLVCHDDKFLRRLDRFNIFSTQATIQDDIEYLESHRVM